MEEQPVKLEELVSQAGGEIAGPLEPATRQLSPVELKLLRLAIEHRGNIVSAADVELGEAMKLIGLAVDVEYKVDFETGIVTLPAPRE